MEISADIKNDEYYVFNLYILTDMTVQTEKTQINLLLGSSLIWVCNFSYLAGRL